MKKTILVLALLVISGCVYPEPKPYQIFGIQKFQEIKRNPKPHVGKLYAFGANVSSLVLDAVALYDSFTRYPFWLSRNEELFNKWKTGEPFTACETHV